MRGEEGNKKKELKKAIGGAREEGSDTMKIFVFKVQQLVFMILFLSMCLAYNLSTIFDLE
ncbi:unnamed protein product [Brassica oleracea var. botrytis]